MSESADYDPAPWAKAHDFDSARQTYQTHAGRSYQKAVGSGVSAGDLVPDSLTTQSSHPLLIRCDVSGSMGGWPNPMFVKFPYLDHEVRTEYLGDDAEISFGAISDVEDTYPLQFQPFTQGAGLKESMEKLIITSGGAGPGSLCEAYSLSALYDLRNVYTPKSVIIPPLILIGDEMPFYTVQPHEALNIAKVQIDKPISAETIFEELMERYAVYMILKPYGHEQLKGDQMETSTTTVFKRWSELLGVERIALLSDPDRVVDVIFGLLAHYSNRIDYFRKEIEGRQKPGQVDTVYQSLETIHSSGSGKSRKLLPPGSSKLHTKHSGTDAKPLI